MDVGDALLTLPGRLQPFRICVHVSLLSYEKARRQRADGLRRRTGLLP